MNTDEERAIVAAATPGPWERVANTAWDDQGYIKHPTLKGPDRHIAYVRSDDGDPIPNATFIARARTVLPLALDVVAAAEAWSEADEKWGSGMTDVPPAFRLDGLRAALDAWKAAQ